MPSPAAVVPSQETAVDLDSPRKKKEVTAETVALSERETLLALPVHYGVDSATQTIPEAVTDPSNFCLD